MQYNKYLTTAMYVNGILSVMIVFGYILTIKMIFYYKLCPFAQYIRIICITRNLLVFLNGFQVVSGMEIVNPCLITAHAVCPRTVSLLILGAGVYTLFGYLKIFPVSAVFITLR